MHSNIFAQVFFITASLFLSAFPVFSQPKNGSEIDRSPRTVLNFHEKPLPAPPPAPKAGVLTAAEWSDLENWRTWKELLDSREGEKLISGEEVLGIWSMCVTETDKFFPCSAKEDFAAFAEKWGILQLAGSGVDETASLPDCPQGNGLDLLFAIDATGSMADELSYLQAELADVIRRAHRVQPGLQTRSAIVFFRDKEESFLTRSIPFSSDIDETLDFLKQQRAGGGGETPEAVEAALEEALRLDWSEHARARLLFLITDASPDPEPEARQKLQSAIRTAAAKDIRIITVAASEMTREGEFVMRAMALATRSPYVFLSDDSGVGDIHEEPSIGGVVYVQPFNDLLVRLIAGYTASMPCPQGDAARLPSGSASETLAVRCFPNPTSGVVHIRTAEETDVLMVYNAQGQVALRQNLWPAGANTLDLTGRPPGVYFLEFMKNDKVKTVRVVVE